MEEGTLYHALQASTKKGAGSTPSPGAETPFAGWTLQCTQAHQTRRSPTGGGFISRSCILWISCTSTPNSAVRSKELRTASRRPPPAISRLGAARSGAHHSPVNTRNIEWLRWIWPISSAPTLWDSMGLQLHRDFNDGTSAPLAISLSTRHSFSTSKAPHPSYL